jgi:hypothetical protein
MNSNLLSCLNYVNSHQMTNRHCCIEVQEMALVLKHFIQNAIINRPLYSKIFKAHDSSYIFGGFTAVSWESSTNGKCKSGPNAFIFSLTNNDNKPLKMKIHPKKRQYAIYCHFECGPTFGIDLCIADNANTTMVSFSNLGFTYSHPQYEYGTNEAQTFLAGSYQFQLDEIEVYQKE